MTIYLLSVLLALSLVKSRESSTPILSVLSKGEKQSAENRCHMARQGRTSRLCHYNKILERINLRRKGMLTVLRASGLRTRWSYGFGPLIGMPGGNGRKRLSGQTVYLMVRK